MVSGLDDLFITLVGFATCRLRFAWPSATSLRRAGERPIAVFVPLWHEHAVIGRMLEHNLKAIKYRNYHFFVGVYPNDAPTIRAVTQQARRHPRIHVATCPHDGPTSKGDCLNWIYQRMKDHEARHNMRFRIVMMHDAEDLIHPDSLRLVNWFSRRYAMVQVPVLPLATGVGEFTHGLYCDEFAEYQQKDIPVRQTLGGFLPSNGVGTGFDRAALERVAATRCGRPFDPSCLTEDYETGYLLHSMGYSQVFVPVRAVQGGPVATREYFPRRFRAAISQRTRWVTGIALQSWERHGWNAPWPQLYWFWRDRKGLIGNLLTPVANLFFLYGTASYLSHLGQPGPWHLGSLIPNWISDICRLTFAHRAVADRCTRPGRGADLRLVLRRGRARTHVLGKPGKFCRHRHRAVGIFEGSHQRPWIGLAQDRPCVPRGPARPGYQRDWVSSAGGCFRKRRNSGILLMNRSSRLSFGGSGARSGVTAVSLTGTTGGGSV